MTTTRIIGLIYSHQLLADVWSLEVMIIMLTMIYHGIASSRK